MSLNDNSFTWFLAWSCLRVKPILFDRLPPLTAVFWYQQPEKLWKWPFLRHFTAKNDTKWWQLHLICGMSMSQGQTITVSPFDNYSSTFRTSTTWKTVKIAIFTAFYGKKWHWMMTASFEFWHKYVSESNYYCSTVLPPISAVCEHKNPEKLSKRPFLRHFTSFYGSVWTILFQMCSITFFDFYTIYVIGLGQKICTLTKFPK